MDPRFNSTTSTKVTVGSASTAIVADNPDRKYLAITNVSDEAVTLDFGGTAVANEGYVLNPLPTTGVADRLILTGDAMFTGAINGICASGSKVVGVVEG